MKLEGLYTAMITPFTQGKLDEEGLVRLIHRQLEAKVDGLVFLGTTAESPTLTEKEAQRVLEIAVKEVKGATCLIVGTGTNCTQTTIDKTNKAMDLGADMALIISPYYNCPTQNGLLKHFEHILEKTNLPLILYNHPKRTGVHLELTTLIELSKHEKIRGLKETYGDKKHLDLLFQTFKEHAYFTLLSGCDEEIYDWMSRGMRGVISVLSNAYPKALKALVQALLKKEAFQAKELFDRALPFIDFCRLETNPIPIKALLNGLGLPAGSPRLPLCDLSEDHYKILEEILETSSLEPVCKN